MKLSTKRLLLLMKKYKHQISITSLLTLVLFTYNNCGKDNNSKLKKLTSKSMMMKQGLVTVGSPMSLLTYPGPKSPLINLGDGKIVNNRHTAFPGLPAIPGYNFSGWQLDQTPGRELMNPTNMLLTDSGYDSLLGKANWIFPTQKGDTHLKIFNNSQYGLVYEMFSKNGSVGPYGGTGLILGAMDLPVKKVTGRIKLDLDFRLSKVISSNPNNNPSFHWFALSGLYFAINNPETGAKRSFLIQIVHANHKAISEDTNYRFDNGVDSPMLGGIVNSDLDKVFYSEMSDFKHITLDINKYMCFATKQQYGSASGKVFTLPEHYKNPKNWSFSGYFFDLEHASQNCTDPNPVYGENCPAKYIQNYGAQLEVGVQVANINITQDEAVEYSDICQGYPEYNSPTPPTASVFIDNIANQSKTITAGQSIDLKYESNHATSCTLTAYLNGNELYKNVDFSPAHNWGQTKFNESGTYRWDILCKNAVNQATTASASLNVIASPITLPPKNNLPIANFYLDNVLNASKTITVNEVIDLKYESLNADSCTLTAYLNGKIWYQNVNFTTSHNWGKVPFNLAGDVHKWEIVCKNAHGTATSAVNLKVIQGTPIANFYINNVPNTTHTIKAGQNVDLRYEATAVKYCTLTGYINNKLWYKNPDFLIAHNWGHTPFKDPGIYRWTIDCKDTQGKQVVSSAGVLIVLK